MNRQILHPLIIAARPDAWPPPNRRGDSAALVLPDQFLKQTRDTLVWSGDLPEVGRGFVKMYRHRSPLSWCAKRLIAYRAEREYRRLLVLHGAGVPCAEPLMCAAGRSPEHGRYEVLVTREIPHARQFKAYLAAARAGGRKPDLAPLFRTIRKMHAAGIYHGTLTPNNIVVSEPPGGPVSFHVVDLPRAIAFSGDVAATRMARYDLTHFLHRSSEFVDLEVCLPVLDLYPDLDREAFLRKLSSYRPGKWMRYRLRNEFGWRARLHLR
jgi:hypothetical protein